MEQDKITIGRIREYDEISGTGEIISLQSSYMFLIDDVCDKEINKGDLVKFRAEKVNNINKAFFIRKYETNKELNGKIAKSKIYRSNQY